jgi:spore coat polysaccharide biosynthesis predicted glycosyltransferase SpsG
MNKVVFLVDARREAGFGNLSRVRALSKELKSEKAKIIIKAEPEIFEKIQEKEYDEEILIPSNSQQEISTVVNFLNSNNANYLVTDLFAGKYLNIPEDFINYHLEIKKNLPQLKLITIDDVRTLQYKNNYANLSVISNTTVSCKMQRTRIIGSSFTIFNPAIVTNKKYVNNKKIYKFLISFGGLDNSFDTLRVIEAIKKYNLSTQDEGVKVILGKAFPSWYISRIEEFCRINGYETTFFYDDYYKDITSTQIVICGEGTTKFDALALGVPPVVITQFDHFSKPIREFIDSDLSYYFGKTSEFTEMKFADYINGVLKEKNVYEKKRERGLRTYDGLGAQRIMKEIEKL